LCEKDLKNLAQLEGRNGRGNGTSRVVKREGRIMRRRERTGKVPIMESRGKEERQRRSSSTQIIRRENFEGKEIGEEKGLLMRESE